MSIAENLLKLKAELTEEVTLVAVSKTKPNSAILEAYATGQRIFGENKVQEMTDKWEALPKDIQWHMIGHLQSNKVKYLIPYVSLIHSADRLSLLKEINRQAARFEKTIHVLLQIKIAEEDSKFGMNPDEALTFLTENTIQNYPNIKIVGLMGMASFIDDESQIKREFEQLQTIYNRFKETYNFTTLSMGMSGDYKLAISCGSTMIRVGSSIFGERNYQ